MEQQHTKKRSPLILVFAIAVVIILIAVLAVTKPWTAFTSSTIDEELPGQTQTETVEATATGSDEPETNLSNTKTNENAANSAEETTAATPTESAPVTVSTGSFTSIDHETKGEASVVTLPNGKNYIRLENLAGSDGPDLKVVVTKAGIDPASMKSEDYTSVGDLKATHGNQNYELPDDLDPAEVGQVVIWCERFSSAFGAAKLQ